MFSTNVTDNENANKYNWKIANFRLSMSVYINFTVIHVLFRIHMQSSQDIRPYFLARGRPVYIKFTKNIAIP